MTIRRLTGRMRATLALAMTLLGGCGQENTEPFTQQRAYALGTLVDISVYGAPPEEAGSAIQAAFAELDRIHQRFHAWQPSQLTALNKQLQAGGVAQADPELIALLQTARKLAEQSGQRFNPAAGRLIALWGFHNDQLPRGPPPEADQIQAIVKQQPSLADITIDGTTVTSRNPAVQFDFGAFAKGYAIDRAVQILRQQGVKHAIVNAGGDLIAFGRRGQRPWRIGIRHPREPGLLASLTITGTEAVFTSGDYERFYEYQGRRYHHLIDPRSGYPSRHWASVTVIHEDATTADAAATALMIAGPDQWQAVATAMHLRQVMLVRNDLTVVLSQAMAGRLHFEVTPPRVEVVEL